MSGEPTKSPAHHAYSADGLTLSNLVLRDGRQLGVLGPTGIPLFSELGVRPSITRFSKSSEAHGIPIRIFCPSSDSAS